MCPNCGILQKIELLFSNNHNVWTVFFVFFVNFLLFTILVLMCLNNCL